MSFLILSCRQYFDQLARVTVVITWLIGPSCHFKSDAFKYLMSRQDTFFSNCWDNLERLLVFSLLSISAWVLRKQIVNQSATLKGWSNLHGSSWNFFFSSSSWTRRVHLLYSVCIFCHFDSLVQWSIEPSSQTMLINSLPRNGHHQSLSPGWRLPRFSPSLHINSCHVFTFPLLSLPCHPHPY